MQKIQPKKKPPSPEIGDSLQAEYVARDGIFCPGCGTTEGVKRLYASTEFRVTMEGKPQAKVFSSCGACGLDWWEIYHLAGLEIDE